MIENYRQNSLNVHGILSQLILNPLCQKIYEVDPLICPKCNGQMKIISIIDDFDIIEQILKRQKAFFSYPLSFCLLCLESIKIYPDQILLF